VTTNSTARRSSALLIRRWGEVLQSWRLHRAALWLLIFAGATLRFKEASLHSPLHEIFSDPGRHWEFGKDTLGASPIGLVDPPIFQMWMSLVQKWTLAVPFLMALYVGTLSNLTAWFWYRFLRESLHSRTLALAGWAVIVWMPSWIAIFRYFMTETLLLPLMGAALWQTMRADRNHKASTFVGMVLLWALASMTRGIALPLGGLAALWVWLRHPRKIRTALMATVAVAALVVPFGIRNYEFMRLWSPIGSGWPNQIYAGSGAHDYHLRAVRDGAEWNYGFGSPSLYRKQLAPLSNWESSRKGAVQVNVDLRKGAADWKESYARTAVTGAAKLRLRAENLVFVMLGESWPDRNDDCEVAMAASHLRWIWAPLFVLIVAIGAIRWRGTLKRPLLPVLIVTWFLFQAPTLLAVNEGRYRKPLEGMLVCQLLVLLDRKRHVSRGAAARAGGGSF
jgi:hypothetical protein